MYARLLLLCLASLAQAVPDTQDSDFISADVPVPETQRVTTYTFHTDKPKAVLEQAWRSVKQQPSTIRYLGYSVDRVSNEVKTVSDHLQSYGKAVSWELHVAQDRVVGMTTMGKYTPLPNIRKFSKGIAEFKRRFPEVRVSSPSEGHDSAMVDNADAEQMLRRAASLEQHYSVVDMEEGEITLESLSGIMALVVIGFIILGGIIWWVTAPKGKASVKGADVKVAAGKTPPPPPPVTSSDAASSGADSSSGAVSSDNKNGDTDKNGNGDADKKGDGDSDKNGDGDADKKGDGDADKNGEGGADKNGDADKKGDADADKKGDGDNKKEEDEAPPPPPPPPAPEKAVADEVTQKQSAPKVEDPTPLPEADPEPSDVPDASAEPSTGPEASAGPAPTAD